MKSFRVHLREKREGYVLIEAEDQVGAMMEAKRMIKAGTLPTGTMSEPIGIVVTFAEPA